MNQRHVTLTTLPLKFLTLSCSNNVITIKLYLYLLFYVLRVNQSWTNYPRDSEWQLPIDEFERTYSVLRGARKIASANKV